ncbi:uncharacterized protein PAC_16028 [Phialocephala subalpina]|uniref:Uncharacterized protein n=1 Tax=Phialocephala subalpina TaxID=576137 RepID=A0A1L7XMG3_9HELO|nr:uncharacterized protein PAC_16028 [Phialocephala subalpina]
MPMMRARDDGGDGGDGGRPCKRQRLERMCPSSRDRDEDIAWCCGKRLCACTRSNPHPTTPPKRPPPNGRYDVNGPITELRQLDDSDSTHLPSSPSSPPRSDSSDDEDDDDEDIPRYASPTFFGVGSRKRKPSEASIGRLPLKYFDSIGLPRLPHVPLDLPFPSTVAFAYLKYRSNFEQQIVFASHLEEQSDLALNDRERHKRRKKNEAEFADAWETYHDYELPKCPTVYRPFKPKNSAEDKRIADYTRVACSFLSQRQNDRRKLVAWFEDKDHPVYQERMTALAIWKNSSEARISRWSKGVMFVENPFIQDIKAKMAQNAKRHAKAPRHRRWKVEAGFESTLRIELFKDDIETKCEEGTPADSEQFSEEESDEDEDKDLPQRAGELDFVIGTAE